MRNLTDILNESLEGSCGYEQNDMMTREYNNLFGMLSNTLLRVVPTMSESCVYVLTGSALRDRNLAVLGSCLVPVSTMEGGEVKNTSPLEYLQERGFHVYNPMGEDICCSDDESEPLDGMLVSAARDLVKDNEYVIVA